jgi:hypothetical protein
METVNKGPALRVSAEGWQPTMTANTEPEGTVYLMCRHCDSRIYRYEWSFRHLYTGEEVCHGLTSEASPCACDPHTQEPCGFHGKWMGQNKGPFVPSEDFKRAQAYERYKGGAINVEHNGTIRD